MKDWFFQQNPVFQVALLIAIGAVVVVAWAAILNWMAESKERARKALLKKEKE